MVRTPNAIRMDGDRSQATIVIRGTDLDGLAMSGQTTGRVYFSQPPGRPGLSGGRDDIFGPTSETEVDPVTGRTLVVYRFQGFAPLPRWTL